MKKLLIISHVLPFPGNSGQQLRVRNTIQSLRKSFHVTFLTACRATELAETTAKLEEHADEVVCLQSLYNRNAVSKLIHMGVGSLYSVYSSLKMSNYVLAELEFTPSRIAAAVAGKHFDLVLFEYWHAFKTASVFQALNIPCVVDTHNILSSSLRQQLINRGIPSWISEIQTRRYSSVEEKAWNAFSGVIAINREEEKAIRSRVPDRTIFYIPMGIDLSAWPFSRGLPSGGPVRIGYYGGLGSPHNQRDALAGYRKIMPIIWDKFPDAEYWMIGSNPPEEIRSLPEIDGRVRVTGFINNVPEVLRKLNVVICPWQGRYGFRSRLVEVMATGIPLVTTPDAVDGMEFEHEREVMLGSGDLELASLAMRLLERREDAERVRKEARSTVEGLYSIDSTYGRLNRELITWLDSDLRNVHTAYEMVRCNGPE